MEDKTFDLLEKLYSEFSECRKETNIRFDKLESNVRGLKNDIIRIENKMDVLYDGYKVVYEKLQEHDKRFDAIEEELEKHDVEIRVIKGAK